MPTKSRITRTLRIGLVGCGGIAEAHVDAYNQVSRARIVAVYDPRPTAARRFAADTGADVASSLKQMTADHQLDAVSICSPPGVHVENCLPFLKAGIAVLCEKPLAHNTPAAARIARAVKSTRTPFMVAFCHRFHPAVVALKKLMDRRVLGQPKLFRNIFASNLPMRGTHHAVPALSGGGCLLSNGCHSFDLFRFLIGRPTHVQAMTANITQKVPVEDLVLVHLNANNKAYAEISSSFSLAADNFIVEVRGTRGRAAIEYFNKDQPDLVYYLKGEPHGRIVDVSGQPNRFVGEVRHFLDALRAGARPSVTAEDGLIANRIAAACYKSAKEGRRIRL
ncbi:MAG: hypothetical protein CMJ49_00475 [Planctomycetaceae bacterium]|nr:hypothetical protein [Planctomycetaceae bacterium]